MPLPVTSGASAHHFTDTLQQPRWRRFLEQVATRAGADGLENPVVIAVHCQHQHLELRVACPEPPDAFDAGHSRQSDVH